MLCLRYFKTYISDLHRSVCGEQLRQLMLPGGAQAVQPVARGNVRERAGGQGVEVCLRTGRSGLLVAVENTTTCETF